MSVTGATTTLQAHLHRHRSLVLLCPCRSAAVGCVPRPSPSSAVKTLSKIQMGNLFCCVQVDQSTVAIKEGFGRFEDVLEPGCHCLPWFLGSQLAGHLSLRLQQLDVRCETNTKTEIAKAVEEELEKAMSAYGYEIVQTLIVDIEPDEHVKRAMNEINAESPGSSGYLIVDANGGLNQQRSALLKH
ncbi:hypothetical protein GOBAR_AA37195 [Gossypium barbadense]|uniref:Band 7 domain-containing protein n=1 Tax=Gossypium barbadense TaxID=3634 RepID=A0A2P5VXG0_GOSBA|nr:hypothetical protein GOBAR_AA37195 [Gossypium barbadense]